jgi:hypothetical protein
MKFAAERPFADPEAAARKLSDMVRGRDYAFTQRWFEFDRSQTRIILLPDGAE